MSRILAALALLLVLPALVSAQTVVRRNDTSIDADDNAVDTSGMTVITETDVQGALGEIDAQLGGALIEGVNGHHAFISEYYANGSAHTIADGGTADLTSTEIVGLDPKVGLDLAMFEERDNSPGDIAFTFDGATDEFTLTGLKAAAQFAIRINWDVDPDVDESTCSVHFFFTRSRLDADAETNFTIDATLPHLNQGAGVMYSITEFTPVFVSGSLADSKDHPAKLQIQASCDQDSTVYVRDTVFYFWE